MVIESQFSPVPKTSVVFSQLVKITTFLQREVSFVRYLLYIFQQAHFYFSLLNVQLFTLAFKLRSYVLKNKFICYLVPKVLLSQGLDGAVPNVHYYLFIYLPKSLFKVPNVNKTCVFIYILVSSEIFLQRPLASQLKSQSLYLFTQISPNHLFHSQTWTLICHQKFTLPYTYLHSAKQGPRLCSKART